MAEFIADDELVEVTMKEAIKKSAELMVESEYPILYGWSSTSCEAVRTGLELAEEVEGERVSSDTGVEISDEIKKCMKVLIEEILHSLDYYSSQRRKKIKKIAISGGCAYLNNIGKFLSARLGLSVERNNPFARMSYDSRRFSPDYLEREGSFFAVGSGLALRKIAQI